MFANISRALIPNSKKCLAAIRSKHTLPDLPYDYNALEPVISAEIMQLHHQKHHATYVNNLNVAEEKILEAKQRGSVTDQIALAPALKFNGGGHINHSIFWTVLCKNGTSEPEGELAEAIKRDFGTYQRMVDMLVAASTGIQGSGWGWLGYNKAMNKLEIAACPNQDPLQATTGLHPLFGIDVWEHAYYLQYKSARADYVKNIFKIANWRRVEELFGKARYD
uniref:Superoxide dismutase n=1 Tax=Brachionus koreanus TaxID=1199090 RepID=A0A0A7DN73_9BILA|nr:manganese superoxide dismutase [Brachionus koreanus]